MKGETYGVKTPEAIRKSADDIKGDIKKALENGEVIDYDSENIVELFAYNIAITECVDEGTFEGYLNKLDIFILDKLKGGRVFVPDKFIKLVIENYRNKVTKALVARSIEYLENNNLIKRAIFEFVEKKRYGTAETSGHYQVIGRGPCVALRKIAEKLDLFYLQPDCSTRVLLYPDHIHKWVIKLIERGVLLKLGRLYLVSSSKKGTHICKLGKGDEISKPLKMLKELSNWGLIKILGRGEGFKVASPEQIVVYKTTELGMWVWDKLGTCEVSYTF